PAGFRWIEPNDAMNNVLVFARRSKDGSREVVCIANLSPVPRESYRVGLPRPGDWAELLNTDSTHYGGSGIGNMGQVTAEQLSWHGQPYSAVVTVPPPAGAWLRPA